jgi:hypothetical protein
MPLHEGKVSFALALPVFLEPLLNGPALGEDQNARDRTIQPVNQPGVRSTAGIAAHIPLHARQEGGFVTHPI